MRKLFAILTALFALTFLSAAQTGGTSGGGTDQDTGKKHSEHKGGGGGTITGCLTGPNDEGVYVLTHGKRTVEVGGLDDLSKHVNHEVKLHGNWTKNPADIGEKEGTATKEGKEEKGERHFKVSSIDHVADTCTGGGKAAGGEMGEHHKKKGSGTSQPSTPPKL